MKVFSNEIEFRRLGKILLKKISFELKKRMIKTKNINIIPKNFSWGVVNQKIYHYYNLKIKNFKKMLGFISWNNNYNRFFEVVKKIEPTRNLNYFDENLFGRYFFRGSNFTLSKNKFIDSYFQIERKCLINLPIVFSLENCYGILLSKKEILKILFRNLNQSNIFFRKAFIFTKTLFYNFIPEKIIYGNKKKIEDVFIEIVLRKKSE